MNKDEDMENLERSIMRRLLTLGNLLVGALMVGMTIWQLSRGNYFWAASNAFWAVVNFGMFIVGSKQ